MSRKHRESSQTRARSKNDEFDNGRTKLKNLKEQGGMQSPTCSTCDFDSCGPEASRSGRFCRWAGDVEFLLRTRQAAAWPIQRSEKRVHLAPQGRKLSELHRSAPGSFLAAELAAKYLPSHDSNEHSQNFASTTPSWPSGAGPLRWMLTFSAPEPVQIWDLSALFFLFPFQR